MPTQKDAPTRMAVKYSRSKFRQYDNNESEQIDRLKKNAEVATRSRDRTIITPFDTLQAVAGLCNTKGSKKR